MTNHVLPAKLHRPISTSNRLEVLVLVEDPVGTVRVRWTSSKRVIWRCDLCGPQEAVECDHTFSAGLLLAEKLLGLVRMPELQEVAHV